MSAIPLSSTFDDSVETPYKEALTRAKPDADEKSKNLWLRDPDTLEDSLQNKYHDLVDQIKSAIELDGEERKNIIKNVFGKLLINLETGFTEEQVSTIIDNFDKFNHDLIVPIEKLNDIDNTYLLNESYGPTDAFKDIALQMLTSMVAIIVEEQNRKSIEEAVINGKKGEKLKFVVSLTSTSGDTGPAGGSGILDKRFVMNAIGFPEYEATYAQKGQMMLLGSNVISFPMNESFSAIQEAMQKGNTADFQKKLKQIIKHELRDLIAEYGFEIEVDSGSFNSINPGRIDGQTIYHQYGIMQAEAMGIVNTNEDLIEVIPSGNGGHMYSLLMAYLSTGRKYSGTAIITCNRNNLFYKIIEEGRFKKPKKGSKIDEPSVSMIIEYPNNMVRLFSYAFGKTRAEEITTLFFSGEEVILTDRERATFKQELGIFATEVSGKEELTTIGETFEKTGTLICPHTANALKGLEKHRETHLESLQTPALVSATASPWKFLAATAAGLSFKKTSDIEGLYNEYKEIEKTKEGTAKLLKIIEGLYADFGKEFNIEIIPENLRYIFTNGYEQTEVITPQQFQEKTKIFLSEEAAPMFREQVEEVIQDVEDIILKNK